MFTSKKTTLIISLCLLVVVVMGSVLITLLVQNVTFKNRAEELAELKNDREALIQQYQQDLELRNDWDFIIQKARELGLLTDEEILWMQQTVGE